MKNRDMYWRRYKIQEILYIGQWHLSSLQSRHLGTSHSSSNWRQWPIVFSESHRRSEIFSLSKVILVRWKARSHRVPNLGCSRAESGLGDLMFGQKTAMPEWAHCCDEAANHQLSVDLFLYSLSHFEWDGHTAHLFTQWLLLLSLTSTVKSSWFTHVHFNPLSLAARLHLCRANCSHYINNGWTFSRQTSYMEDHSHHSDSGHFMVTKVYKISYWRTRAAWANISEHDIWKQIPMCLTFTRLIKFSKWNKKKRVK